MTRPTKYGPQADLERAAENGRKLVEDWKAWKDAGTTMSVTLTNLGLELAHRLGLGEP